MYAHDCDFTIDSFSKLPNLFGFIENEAETIASFHGAAVCLDVVGLGRINEACGREVGDSCLTALVLSLNDTLAAFRGRAYRVSGDNFVALLPAADRERGQAFCDALLAGFSQRCSETVLKFWVGTLPENALSVGALLVRSLLCGNPHDGSSISADEVLSFMDRMVGWARENIDLVRNAVATAATDATTGLPNSRAAEKTLAEELQRYHDEGRPFAVLLIDGDQLKQYNDRLGYSEGNDMIRRLAQVIQKQVRLNDFVARWLLGDEFVVLLRGIPRAKASLMAERIRRAVSEESLTWPMPISISIGVAGCPENGTDIHSVLKAAETANHEAKREGKNRVK